jgi:FHS family L-fucose permease-like MFS transporter
MKFISPAKIMGFYAAMNVVLVSMGIIFPGAFGMWCVFLTSFFMSLMFPTIFALGLKGLGPNTKIGGSLLVMAIIGGAVLTPAMGLIAEKAHSLALAYSIPLLAYVYVAIYSFAGARQKDMQLPSH